MSRRDLAAHRGTAPDLGACLCWAAEAGQGPRPPKARTWAPRGRTLILKVTGKGYGRVNLAGLVCARLGERTRLIYHAILRRGRKGEAKSFDRGS